MFCDVELVLSDKTKGDIFNVLYATWPATKVGQRLYKFAVILNPYSNSGIYISDIEKSTIYYLQAAIIVWVSILIFLA